MFEIGSSLREARERQERTFADLENRTQIRSRYLKALEDEQFDRLPGFAYVRGFLRVYADELGLEGQLYIDEFNSRFSVVGEASTPFRRREKRSPATSRQSRRVASGAVVVSLATIAIVLALFFAAFASKPEEQNVPNLPTTTTSAQGKTTLELTAVGGDSWAEVHANDENGDLLYGGTLVKGHSRTFQASRIWVKVAAVQNIRWTLGGNDPNGAGNRVGPAVLVFTPVGHEFLPK